MRLLIFSSLRESFSFVEKSVSDNNKDNIRPYIFDVNVRFVIRKKNLSRKSRIVLEDLSLNSDLR